jgi:hypothetical protein
MRDIETVDHHVLLRTAWDGRDRLLFTSHRVLDKMAGRKLDRAAARQFVDQHRDEIVALGKRRVADGPGDANRIVFVESLPE